MRVVLLGTGTSQGVPIIGCNCEVCHSIDKKDKRLRCSILIEMDNGFTLVIDTGPDFRYQMLRAGVKRLDAILFTHDHKDHTAGMDDVRAFNFLQKKPMDMYATEQVQQSLQKAFDYVFSGRDYPGLPQVNLHTIDKNPFSIEEVNITPIEVWHYQLPVLGFRIKDFTYITDANLIEEEELLKIRGSKVLIINALRKEKHISHFTLGEATEIAKKLQVEQAYFTHISHKMGLHQLVDAELKEGFNLAYDGLELFF